MGRVYDTVIVGGGFYGLRIAQFLRQELKQKNILVIDKEDEVMQRASFNNQARVHNGYHYPRSVLTALRSRVNLPIFSKEYQAAIKDDFDAYYGVATNYSQVSSSQFERFFERIGAEIEQAPTVKNLFDKRLIENVFKVKEFAFSSTALKQQLLSKLGPLGITIHTKEQAAFVESDPKGLVVVTDRGSYVAKSVINTTYSSINLLNQASHLPVVPLKHELTEMCLVDVPEELQNMAITIMCGPFFSLMPFPDRGSHTLSHVRFTPHSEWIDGGGKLRNGHNYLKKKRPPTHFPQMYADVKRYLPAAEKIRYSGESLWEVKTVLPQSDGDDSRPIMYLKDYGGLKNYTCIMGGKIDNIYDVFQELREAYA